MLGMSAPHGPWGFPAPQGLYDPGNEKDSCGVGFVCDIGGKASHSIVERGIEVLNNLLHRGAAGADAGTGDGAGILVQIPDRFFARRLPLARLRAAPGRPLRRGHDVPAPGAPRPRRPAGRPWTRPWRAKACSVLGWREVPVEPAALGESARATRPSVWQCFTDSAGLERRGPRAQALRGPPAVRESGGRGAGSRRPLLRPQLLLPHHRLQGPHDGHRGPGLLPGPERPVVRERPGRRPPALQHQHVPLLGAGPAVPLPGPQRRDQHAARQPQPDAARAQSELESDLFGDDIAQAAARSSTRAAATRPASTTRWSC